MENRIQAKEIFEKKIFRFIELDAWGIECDKDILVIDEMKDNICLNPDCELPMFFSIDYEDIKKIKDIIAEHEYIFKIKNVQSPDWILDGSRQEIFFWNKDIINKIETNNLERWEDNDCKYRNTKYLLKIINDISKILSKYEIRLM